MNVTLPPAKTKRVAIVANDPEARGRLREELSSDELALIDATDAPGDIAVGVDAVVVALGSDGDGPAAIAAIRAAAPEVPIIVTHPGPSTAELRDLMRAGARGFVNEADAVASLLATVEAVVVGQMVLPVSYHHRLDRPNLTAREKQVLAMVVMGFSNAEIATKLFLSESTVKSHLSAAFAKLGVRSRKDAAALILDPHSTFGPGILTITPPDSRQRATAA
jgi:two-component system response regulator DesR